MLETIPRFDLSIVIVNYNSSLFLHNCLEKIYAATNDYSVEVIIIDNKSNDTSEVELCKQYPNARVIINNENLGFSKACNQGLANSAGNYVLISNPDILVPTRIFDRLFDLMEFDKTIGMIGPKLVRPNGKLDPACFRLFPSISDMVYRTIGVNSIINWLKSKLFSFPIVLDLNKKQFVDCISGAFMLVRQQAIQEVGFLDERFFMYFEDLDWGIRFNLAGWRVVYDPSVEVVHFKRASSKQISSKMIREFFNSYIFGYDKYYSNSNLYILNAFVRTLFSIKKICLLLWDFCGYGPWKENISVHQVSECQIQNITTQ